MLPRRAALVLPALFLGAAAPSALQARAHFECLWWAESQMEGLRSDSPLPKTTRVRLEKWEYSDPVGVPNPDEIILVLTLLSPTARTVQIAPRLSWHLRDWQAGQHPLPRPVALQAGVAHTEEFIIPVRKMIYDRAPKRLAVSVLADGKPITRAELRIIGGD